MDVEIIKLKKIKSDLKIKTLYNYIVVFDVDGIIKVHTPHKCAFWVREYENYEMTQSCVMVTKQDKYIFVLNDFYLVIPKTEKIIQLYEKDEKVLAISEKNLYLLSYKLKINDIEKLKSLENINESDFYDAYDGKKTFFFFQKFPLSNEYMHKNKNKI